jgi:hypothetical protein
MAITTGICYSYLQEILQGIHSSTDTYKIALYTSSASIGPSTTAYTTTGEASGSGYTAGGATLSGFNVTTDSGVAILDFTTDPSWSNSTITARGCLIYNATKANRAVAVYDFGSDVSSTNGTFQVVFPAPAATTGLVRIG